MKEILFFILLFVGANCQCLPISLEKQIRESSINSELNNELLKRLQISVDQLKKFEHQLDAIQHILMQQEAQNSTLQMEAQNSTLQMEAQNSTLQKKAHNSTLQKEEQNFSDDCSDLYNSGLHVSKSYLLPKYNKTVLCDMETDGGQWLVIQQRKKVTNQVDFNRDWFWYKEGFGDLDTEFWIGNEFLHRLTNQNSYELRIDMEDFEKGPFYAAYNEFRVGNEDSGYKLHVGGYKGSTKDSLSAHNGRKFSTFDRDNDTWGRNCAKELYGGFWYYACGHLNLNGLFPTVPDRNNRHFIRWWNYIQRLILIKVEMKIRPKKENKTVV